MSDLSNITAVILAGGFGTRIKSLLGDLPKPMVPVNGKPFIEWIVRWLKAQGVRDVIISAGYRAEALEKHFSILPVPEMNVCCINEPKPMGTGGGLAFAANKIEKEPDLLLVLNGDSLIFPDLNLLHSDLDDAEGVIVTRPVPDTARYGSVHINESNRITDFDEKRPGAGQINGGVYLLRNSLLKSFLKSRPLSLEKDVFPEFIREGIKLNAHSVNSPFLDIGTPETLPLAEAFISENQAHFA
tara:strand:+ start:927 stop:1655 length:729 start_codon:yes stop_codon:yes gene_type:complete